VGSGESMDRVLNWVPGEVWLGFQIGFRGKYG
jgi:hypothetical protein